MLQYSRLVKKYLPDPWDGHFHPALSFPKNKKMPLTKFLLDGSTLSSFIIDEIRPNPLKKLASSKNVVIIGLCPNNEPHLGTMLQLLVAKKIQQKGFDLIISFNDIESVLIRKDAQSQILNNINRWFIPAFKKIGIKPDLVVLRSKEKNLFSAKKFIDKFVTDEDLLNIYGRKLTQDERESILFMVAELLRYQKKLGGSYDNIVVSYGIEEMAHILWTNVIAHKTKLDSIYALITRQIQSTDRKYKMSKSRPLGNISILDENKEILNKLLKFQSRESHDCLFCAVFDLLYPIDSTDNNCGSTKHKYLLQLLSLNTKWQC